MVFQEEDIQSQTLVLTPGLRSRFPAPSKRLANESMALLSHSQARYLSKDSVPATVSQEGLKSRPGRLLPQLPGT